MCLEIIRPDVNRFEKGWKVFRFRGNELRSQFRGRIHVPLPENKWIHYKAWSTTGKRKIYLSLNEGYPQGWHVEATKKGAERWREHGGGILRKVLCRDMHTTGRQGGSKVGVCRWIKILPEAVDVD